MTTILSIETQIIVASVRNPIHVIEAGMLGAEIVTIPPAIIEQMVKHPLTDKGIAQFLEDAKKIGTKKVKERWKEIQRRWRDEKVSVIALHVGDDPCMERSN